MLVVSGPGGVGKGTIVRQLVARDPRLWLSRSWTTRARREGEPEDAYTFVDKAAFRDRIDSGGFLEWAKVLGKYYGTPVPDAGALDVVLEIDVQGAEKVLERCDNVVCVLLLAPSREVQAQRLRGRGDDEDHVQRRLELGDREVEVGRRLAHAVVVNDDVERATDELAAIVEQSRQRFSG